MYNTNCKKFADSSIGLVEIVDDLKTKKEANNYCQNNDGMLIPLQNQKIVDEVSGKLFNCYLEINERNIPVHRKKTLWNVGIECKDKSYNWSNGEKFNESSYQPSFYISAHNCEDIIFHPDHNTLLPSPSCQQTKTCRLPFLCLKDKKFEQTAKVNGFGEEQTNIFLIIGFSVCIFLLLILICWLILKIVRLKKNLKSFTDGVELQVINDDVINTENDEHEEKTNIIYNINRENEIYTYIEATVNNENIV